MPDLERSKVQIKAEYMIFVIDFLSPFFPIMFFSISISVFLHQKDSRVSPWSLRLFRTFTASALIFLFALSTSSNLAKVDFDLTEFPPAKQVIPVDSPQVRLWLAEIDIYFRRSKLCTQHSPTRRTTRVPHQATKCLMAYAL